MPHYSIFSRSFYFTYCSNGRLIDKGNKGSNLILKRVHFVPTLRDFDVLAYGESEGDVYKSRSSWMLGVDPAFVWHYGNASIGSGVDRKSQLGLEGTKVILSLGFLYKI